jgi:hypothetical protein
MVTTTSNYRVVFRFIIRFLSTYFEFRKLRTNKSDEIVGTVTCKDVRVTKMTGYSSDNLIYWHLGYSLS